MFLKEENMTVLYVQHWDIIRSKEESYSNFVINEYNPVIEELGIKIVGGYYVEVGEGPGTIACFTFNELSTVNDTVTDVKFLEITNKLTKYVKNRKSVLAVSTGRVKGHEYTLQKNSWKWNFYYNVKADKKKEYRKTMEKVVEIFKALDFVELTEEWRVIYGGKADYLLELTFSDPFDIGRLMNKTEFRDLEKLLKKELIDFHSSRILRSTERFEEPRWLKL
jgi:hypothetical protein